MFPPEFLDGRRRGGEGMNSEKIRERLASLRIRMRCAIANVKIDGRSLYVDLCDVGVGWKIYTQRCFEPEETNFFRSILKQGMVVADIGAHIGYFTTLFASAVGPSGRIFAFEPDARNFKLLERNIRCNQLPNVTAFNCALGARVGEAHLYISPSLNQGDHRLYNSGESERKSISVSMDTLDHIFLDQFNSRLDVIKMDVQGYEQKVLEGGIRTLRANPNLIILTEFWPYGLEKAGGSAMSFFDLLAETDFSPFVLKENGSLQGVSLAEALKQLPPFDSDRPDSSFMNLVFMKKKP